MAEFTNETQTVTRQQQIEMGLIEPGRKFVPAVPARKRPTPPAQQRVEQVLTVTPTATQHIELRTSHTDRAWGFLIASLPLYGSFALGVVLVAVALYEIPLLSFAAFVIFWITLVLAWFFGYLSTIAISVEGIALFEAWNKWLILRREQRYRWEFFRNGGDEQ